jgi:NADH:ubiquinone oxidoreductase subunit E
MPRQSSERLINSLLKELAILADDDVSEDLKFTVEKVNCAGACSITPVEVAWSRRDGNPVDGCLSLFD